MNELKLTNNVNIGFKNGRHLGRRLTDCIMVDYLEINSINYYVESKSYRLSLKELIRDYIIWDLREDLNKELSIRLSTNDLKIFFMKINYILSNYKIDINKYNLSGSDNEFDKLYNDIFVAYKNSLICEFEFDFENIFDNKINCYHRYNVIETYFSFDLETFNIINNYFIKDNDWIRIKYILKVLASCMNPLSDNEYMVQEYFELFKFLQGKKFVKIGQTDLKQNTNSIFNLLNTLKSNHTKVVYHGRKMFTLEYLNTMLEIKS